MKWKLPRNFQKTAWLATFGKLLTKFPTLPLPSNTDIFKSDLKKNSTPRTEIYRVAKKWAYLLRFSLKPKPKRKNRNHNGNLTLKTGIENWNRNILIFHFGSEKISRIEKKTKKCTFLNCVLSRVSLPKSGSLSF